MLKAFDSLSPDLIIEAVEAVTDLDFSPFTQSYPSYINRVYEVRPSEGEPYIVKFYRPGRWEHQAILQEHRFLSACAESDIPVAAPVVFGDNQTLAVVEGFPFAVFPKKGGRNFELNEDLDWIRAGRLIARMHQAGANCDAGRRLTLHPDHSLKRDIATLLEPGIIPEFLVPSFEDFLNKTYELIQPLFKDIALQTIHGDCHTGNILNRSDEGLMLIDFDDMAIGPAVQDLWLLLPDTADKSFVEIDLLITGYEEFAPFDRTQIRLIEPLRLMRLIYFLAWCTRQRKDHQFLFHFPDWGSVEFWQKELGDLQTQYQNVLDQPESGLF